jgi:hypothetical protein
MSVLLLGGFVAEALGSKEAVVRLPERVTSQPRSSQPMNWMRALAQQSRSHRWPPADFGGVYWPVEFRVMGLDPDAGQGFADFYKLNERVQLAAEQV